MYQAINFNWNLSKMVEGKSYNFEAEQNHVGNSFTISRLGDICTIVDVNGQRTNVKACKTIENQRVKDVCAMYFCRPMSLTSGQVYKCNVLSSFSSNYTNETTYVGITSPAEHPAHNLATRPAAYSFGIELEVEPRKGVDLRELYTNFASNVWHIVTDSSINTSAGEGLEFVTGAFIAPKDATKPAFYDDFCEALSGVARSASVAETGLHVHISREAFGRDESIQRENIAKVIYMYNYIISDITLTNVFGRDRNEWARRNRLEISSLLRDTRTYAGFEPLKIEEYQRAVIDELMKDDKVRDTPNFGHYPQERYKSVNITNKHTIEFRQGKGNISATKIATLCQFIDALVSYCCKTKWDKLSEVNFRASIPAKYTECKAICDLTHLN